MYVVYMKPLKPGKLYVQKVSKKVLIIYKLLKFLVWSKWKQMMIFWEIGQFLKAGLRLRIIFSMRQNLFLFFIFASKLSILLASDSNATNVRSDKLISIFSVVQFKNTECESNNTLGLCVTVKEVDYHQLIFFVKN